MKLILENWNKFINEAEETGAQKNIFVLVGPPSTGKSHWREQTFKGKDPPYVINRDDIATAVAGTMGWTYDDLFVGPAAVPPPGGIQVDESGVPLPPPANVHGKYGTEGADAGAYRKIAVVFKFEGAEELIKAVAEKRRIAAEKEGESKTIPPEVFDRMFKAFQTVDPGEGFDEVVSVDNIEGLQQYLDEPEQQSMQAEPEPAQI